MARPKYAQTGVAEAETSTSAHKLTTPPVPDHLRRRQVPLTENARQVLERRYVRKGPDGQPVESIPGMFWRVAWHVAAAEEALGGDHQKWAERFYRLLTALEFLPNSPTFTGAGTPLGQLAACFVLPIEDDMGKVRGGIFDTLLNAALIQQTGGGNGFSFSRLRPLGEHVISSAGRATGPVGFLRVYDKAFGEIAQGGCLVPETLVFTDQGLLRLDELVDPRRRGWQPHALHVATDQGWRFSPHGYNNGVAPVVRVHTRAGIGLTGTPDHKVKVMSEAGPVWRPLEALRPGDRLMVRLGEHRGQAQPLCRPHGVGDTHTLPAHLDEELAFFPGLSGRPRHRGRRRPPRGGARPGCLWPDGRPASPRGAPLRRAGAPFPGGPGGSLRRGGGGRGRFPPPQRPVHGRRTGGGRAPRLCAGPRLRWSALICAGSSRPWAR
ncbi:MAG: ribonucleotide reductase N-terminal alpha domain-containing protein [Ardenticatenia bacterium]|nr:ribonucleotide reductase N-terminal alpha domain-containing protein [Ardenticatenia bacterium]